MKNIRATIKALKAMGFSQEAIAKRAKVSQMTISRWSRENPTVANVQAIERIEKFYAKECASASK